MASDPQTSDLALPATTQQLPHRSQHTLIRARKSWLDFFSLSAAVRADADVTAMHVVIHPHGVKPRYVVVGDADGRLLVFSPGGDLLHKHDSEAGSEVTALVSYALSRNHTAVVSGHRNGEIRTHHLTQATPLASRRHVSGGGGASDDPPASPVLMVLTHVLPPMQLDPLTHSPPHTRHHATQTGHTQSCSDADMGGGVTASGAGASAPVPDPDLAAAGSDPATAHPATAHPATGSAVDSEAPGVSGTGSAAASGERVDDGGVQAAIRRGRRRDDGAAAGAAGGSCENRNRDADVIQSGEHPVQAVGRVQGSAAAITHLLAYR
ncbi:MAG: hypothetical protein WDW36_003667 [Sanguina aurantia]